MLAAVQSLRRPRSGMVSSMPEALDGCEDHRSAKEPTRNGTLSLLFPIPRRLALCVVFTSSTADDESYLGFRVGRHHPQS